MKKLLVALAIVAAGSPVLAETVRRPVSTYSIVARDPETGDLGVAVQSQVDQRE